MAENLDKMLKIADQVADFDLASLAAAAKDVSEDFTDPVEQAQFRAMVISRAGDLGPDAVRSVKLIFRRMDQAEKEKENEEARFQNLLKREEGYESLLKRDHKASILPTVENFLTIMDSEPYYAGVRFNMLKNAPEKHSVELGKVTIEPWEDADEAASAQFIEQRFGIYSNVKHSQALCQLFKMREYNPVKDIVDTLEWDGTPRVEAFLHRWTHCEDTPYTREVSRLIFAGGINRLYDPGCKFDEVPVLIGTKQGEGKSTIVRWLAIHDDYAGEVTEFDGQQAIEQLEGAWVCEVAELLALTKAREQEAVKTFITRQSDKYRRPYAKNATVLPRRCIFIGTTNNRRFLKDKTGNRRFYPVEVRSSGYELFEHEEECREYILQCWAEARVRYEKGEMPAYADASLREEYEKAQNSAMEDDWIIGAIESYLETKRKGDKICIRQIAREALRLSPDEPARDPTKKESQEIGEIVDRIPGWERLKYPFSCGAYGRQRGWVKTSETTAEELPICNKV